MKGFEINNKYDTLSKYLYLRPCSKVFKTKKFCEKLSKYFGFTSNTAILLIGYKDDVYSVNCFLKEDGIVPEELIIEGKDLTTDCESDVCNPEKLNIAYEQKWDYILFCSRWHAEYITQMLLYNSNRDYRVIDIYEWHEYLLGERITNSITFQDKGNDRVKVRVNNYDVIYCNRKAYKAGENTEEKSFFLERVIEDFFWIRDIIGLKKSISQYENQGFHGVERYYKLIKEIDGLLDEINGSIRCKEGIIVFWTDAVSAKESKEYDFLDEIRKKALVFENAYTHIPYTDTTVHTMITGAPYFEDCDPGGNDRSRCKSIAAGKGLIPWLNERGYSVKENLFYSSLYYPNEDILSESQYYVGYKYKPASLNLWESLMETLNAEKQILLICHCSDNETHHPYWHGYDEFMDIGRCSPLTDEGLMENQKKIACKYAEEQLLFYNELFPDKYFDKIFMSDHGRGVPAYIEDRIHSMFMVRGGIEPGKERRFFSYLKLPELVKWLVIKDNELYDSLFSDYVLVENQDPYSERYTDEVFDKFSKSIEVFNANYEKWAAFRCIVDSEYKIVLFRNGLIKMFKMPSDKEIDIDSLDEKKRIKYINLVKGDFEDLNMKKLFYSNLIDMKFRELRYL